MWSYELITVVNNDKQLYSKGAKFCDDGRDYLIMEWKSGDYRWGGTDTDYYIFQKVDCQSDTSFL